MVRRMFRAFLAAFVLLAACGERSRPPTKLTSLPSATAPAVAPIVERRVVVTGMTRQAGTSVVETAADGTIKATLQVVENGRGAQVEARIELAADGTLAAFEATGRHEMGTKLAESFVRSGDRARWKSEEEQGDREVTGPAFFVPIAETPEVRGLLVQAALRAGGTIALLPAGEAHVEEIAEVEVRAGEHTRTLTGYAITGLSLSPRYTWMDADGRWFGTASSWFSVVPVGWEAAIAPLVARQDEVERARHQALATEHAHRPPAAGIAYTHARVLDVERGKWLADHTVVVVGDTITRVGPSKKVKVPRGAEVVDLAGVALLPGLVDMHGHLGGVDGVLNIASGVTMVRDVGGDPDELDDLKRRFDDGTAIGPHVIRMGFIEGRNEKAAASKITAETEDEALAAVEFYGARGYQGIKIYNSVRPELVPVLAEAAHARGMQVTGHVPVHMLAEDAVRAGYDGIEHINMVFLNFLATRDTDTRDTTRFTLVGDGAADLDLAGEPVRDFIALLRKHGTVIDPTLAAFEDLYSGIPGAITPGLEDTVARLPVQDQRGFLLGGLPGDHVELYARAFDQLLAMVKLLHDAKIPVVLGTDHISGLMLHHEMALFARAGLSPAVILRMATVGAARAMKLDGKVGTIAAGQRADLIVVDGDPLADITAIARVRTTMRSGVVFPAEPLYAAVGVRPAR